MDRTVIGGVVLVGALGAGIAVLAITLSGGGFATSASDGGSMPMTGGSLDGPRAAAQSSGPASEQATPPADDGRAPPGDRSPGGQAATDAQPRVLSATARAFAPFEVEHQRLMHEPTFQGLSPDADPAEIADDVAEALSEVHELSARYWALAGEGDPQLRMEALHRSAMLYDHLADELPPPVVDADGGSTSEWGPKKREAFANSLRDKAAELREASAQPD